MPDDVVFPPVKETIDASFNEEVVVIPVIQEFISIDKKNVETANVTVTKKVHETTEVVTVELQNEAYDIERVAVNRYVDEDNVPQSRQEGDTLILPILKEVIVKRMMLVEEVRITRKVTQTTEQQQIVLRTEAVNVERTRL